MQGVCRWVCEKCSKSDITVPFQARSRYVDVQKRYNSGFTLDIVLKFYRQIKAFAGKDSGAFFIGGN